VFHSFDFQPATIYDVNYLKDSKDNFKNCEIIGDKDYASSDYQLGLFKHKIINRITKKPA
jgi:hypothetical protein